MLVAVIITAAIAIVTFVLKFTPFLPWYKQRARFAKMINVLPGERTYPVVGSITKLFGLDRRATAKAIQQFHDEYPRISRNWLGFIGQVELKRAEYIEKVLGSGKHHLGKAWFYKFVGLWLGEGLLTSSAEKWHSRRKIITPTFHFSILESFCDIFAEKSSILLEKLSHHADTNESFNIYPFITKAALDIIAEAAMGTQIHAQDETENEYVRAVYETAELILRRVVQPWMYLDFFYKRTPSGKKFDKCLGILHSLTNKVIRQRKTDRLRKDSVEDVNVVNDTLLGKKKRLAFLDLLLETSENGSHLSDEDIREEVDTFMFEGHDTTTAGIAWTLFLLGLHPDIQEDVFKEIETIFHGSNRNANIQDFNEMKLLDRVIKESQRLYPSVPTIGRTLTEDVKLDDQYTLPAGLTITIEIMQVHRDERYFPDPLKFDPDRFLPENTVNRHPYAYIPFSAGARNCIGQKFAIYEEKSVLSSIIRNYRVETVGKREDVDSVFELILRPIDGIFMKLAKREK